MKDAIPTALMLACLARKMLLQQQSQREVTELDKMAEFYERSAVGILEECHVTDSQATLTMLCTMRPLYGNLSQLLLAEESQSMNFIEHQACQTCINKMWNRHLNPSIQPFTYLISLIAGVILPPLVPFLADYNYSGTRRSEKHDHGHITSSKANEKKKPPFKSTYKSKFLDFYKAPRVRFAYSAVSRSAITPLVSNEKSILHNCLIKSPFGEDKCQNIELKQCVDKKMVVYLI
ncbi:unnamed protein product [Rodentolepis nana]|uniref:Zinc finger, CCHC-type n=1 Tax=Rodentolepis nana TaxID=102285 RepID=A0A0R3TGY2_RODNA|nr:unnamed protein product [Rodentolepis nana]